MGGVKVARDFTATRVWGVVEALKKAGDAVAQAPLRLRRADDGWAVLAVGRVSISRQTYKRNRSAALAEWKLLLA